MEEMGEGGGGEGEAEKEGRWHLEPLSSLFG